MFQSETSGNEIDLIDIIANNKDVTDQLKNKNTWSGYHVQFRDPKNYQLFAIDEKFNRWGEMVEYFQKQSRPYKLSKGSLKDLLYKTYSRKGHHGLSLNDLVTIRKIDREKLTKNRTSMSDNNIDALNSLSPIKSIPDLCEKLEQVINIDN